MALGGAAVGGEQPDEAVADELLDGMSGPAGKPGGDGDRGERPSVEYTGHRCYSGIPFSRRSNASCQVDAMSMSGCSPQ